MEKLKLLFFVLLGLLTGTSVMAQEEVIENYSVDFETAIETNTSSRGDTNRDFAVSSGWNHLVGVVNIGYSSTPTYVAYTYNATGGVDNGGCLQAGQTSVYDSYEEDYVNIFDYLVTPAVKGTVTLDMKKVNANGFVEFYVMQKDGDSWVAGEQITATASSTANTESFVTFTLPEMSSYTYVGIRMSQCYIDNFTASSANFTRMASLKVNDITPNTDQTIDADADGNFTVTFATTVTNNGDLDLTTGTENYSVSLYKFVSGGGTDKADHVLVATTNITEDLAQSATSGELTLTATLNTADYEAALTNGISFRIYENISGSFKSTKSVKVVPYAPLLTLQTKSGNNTKTYADGEEMYLGTSLSAISQEVTIKNDGGAPLQITGTTVPAGFTSTLTTQEIAAHESATFSIATDENTGVKEGDFVINSNAGNFTLKLKAVVAEADKYFVDFETDASTTGMIVENVVDGWYTYGWKTNNSSDAGYPGNTRNAYMNTGSSAKAMGPFKLITPLLEATAGETFSFEAARYSSSNGELKVYYSADRKEWTLLRTLSTEEGTAEEDQFSDEAAPKYGKAFKRYTINSIPAGQWYIAFEAGNNKPVYLDNILGFKKVDVAHDVNVTAIIPETGIVNSALTVPVTATNQLGKAEAGSDYVAQFIMGDEVVKEIAGSTIAASGNVSFNIDATPHKAGTFDSYVKFVFNDGFETSSEVKSVTISEELFSKEVIAGGTADGQGYLTPFGTYDKKSETQSIYLPTDVEGLTAGAKITSIAFRGYNTKGENITYDTQAWIGETELTGFESPITPIETSTLTKIYDGSITPALTATKNEHEDIIVFNLTEPYTYTGKNLVIAVRNVADAYNMQLGLDYHVTEGVQSIRRSSDSGEFDGMTWKAATPSSYASSPLTLPIAYLGVEAEAPVVSGTVTDKETSQPISGAEVRATSGDVFYTTTTDAEGKYSLDILKDNLDYELKASAEGYAPSKETINVSEGSIADKNIQLEVAKGLYIESSDIPENGMVNMQYTATAKATNYTADNFAAGSYTAKLYVDNKAVAEAEAVEVASGASADFSFTFTPHANGTFPAYIEFVQGENVATTEAVDIIIAEESAGGEIQVGDSLNNYVNAPLNAFYSNSAGDIYYTPAMLEAFGVTKGAQITKITFKMWAKSEKPSLNLTLNAWVGTGDGDPANLRGMSATEKAAVKDELTQVMFDQIYEGVAPAGASSAAPYLTNFEIDLSENPITYDGEHSVRVLIEKSGTTWCNNLVFAYDSNYKTAFMGFSDTSAPEALGTDNSNNPYATPVAYFTVSAGKNVAGTVTDAETSAPIEGASVSVKSGNVLYSGTTDAEGKYSIVVKQVQLEDYVIEASATEEYEVKTEAIGKIENDITKDIALRKAAEITGVITSARDGSVIEGAEVTLLDADENIVSTATADENGIYSIKVQLLDADYKLTVKAEGYVDGEEEIANLTESISKDIALETIAKQISGFVKDAETGAPISAVTLTLKNGEEEVATATTDADGKYELLIEDLTKTYTMEAVVEGYKPATVDVPAITEDTVLDDILLEKEVIDGIDSISADQLKNAKIYDLSGRIVSIDGDMSNLKRGEVYIINGKKMVVK